MSGLIRDLGWQSLENRRRNARLLLFYKGLHGLAAIPCTSLRRPLRNSRTPDILTLTHSLYFLLVLTPTSTRYSLEPFQNGINYRRTSDPNHLRPVFVLPSRKFLDLSKITSSHGTPTVTDVTSIAGYLPKKGRTHLCGFTAASIDLLIVKTDINKDVCIERHRQLQKMHTHYALLFVHYKK